MGELREEIQRMLGESVADDPILLEAQVYATPWEVIPGTAWEVIRTPPTDPTRLVVQLVRDVQRVALRLAEEIETLQST
jgi:hypothetical protein